MPKLLEVVGHYEVSFCLKMNATRVVWTIIGGGDTQTLLAGKKKLSFMHSQVVGCKNFVIFPSSLALALAPQYELSGETFTI